jgi:hypothetical protein
MERAQVFFRQSFPALSSGARPQIAGHAAGQPFAMIVDLGQMPLALVAARAVVVLGQFSSLRLRTIATGYALGTITSSYQGVSP